MTFTAPFPKICVMFTRRGCYGDEPAIDDRILERALKVGGLRTKKETVTKALKEFIERRQQAKILGALGTFRFRADWDYKQDRRGREPRR